MHINPVGINSGSKLPVNNCLSYKATKQGITVIGLSTAAASGAIAGLKSASVGNEPKIPSDKKIFITLAKNPIMETYISNEVLIRDDEWKNKIKSVMSGLARSRKMYGDASAVVKMAMIDAVLQDYLQDKNAQKNHERKKDYFKTIDYIVNLNPNE